MSWCVLQYQVSSHLQPHCWFISCYTRQRKLLLLTLPPSERKNTGFLVALSDFPPITNQGTSLFMPTINTLLNHQMCYICGIKYWISQFISPASVYNSLNKHIRRAKDTHCYVESPASHLSVTRLFWSSHPPPAEKCECSARLSWRTVNGHFCIIS